MTTTLKPTLDHIIVKIDPSETTMASGIIIADSFSKKSNYATVVAVGPNVPIVGLEEGTRVLLTDGAGYDVAVDKVEYRVIKDMNIIAILPGTVDSPDDLVLLDTSVAFEFLDEVSGSKRMFTDRKSAGGIIVTAQKSEQREPRWGRVLNTGPLSEVNIGEYILIEGSMWTTAFKVAGEEVWKTEDKFIIAATTNEADVLP